MSDRIAVVSLLPNAAGLDRPLLLPTRHRRPKSQSRPDE